ncbi:MAG: phosphate acyltransferase PlsX [Anaerovoracaceae bacterium]|jgi:glycerol-3-phosphate acyltransferase PlsX
MKIVLDGMGGDNAPAAIVGGAVLASRETKHEIVIIGREKAIKKELKKHKYDKNQISVVNAEEVIEMEDQPVKAVRSKKDSSMVKGLRMIKEGDGDLFISAGSTGALVAGSLFTIGRIHGIDRPAIASVYPILGQNKASLLVDAGANAECKLDNMIQFAYMGSIYMDKVIGKKDPEVALVNIGEEEGKGSLLYKSAHAVLDRSSLNFIGNIEARDVPKGRCDVIVCDGFTGNVILKLTEGLAWNILKMLKEKLTSGNRAKLGALMLMPQIKELRQEYDYSEYGGAPILGVKGPVVKMHGSSSENAVKNTILKAIPYAEQNVVPMIENCVGDIEEILESES